MTNTITILPVATAEVMESIHGKLTWTDNWDYSVPSTGDTGEDSDGTQAYKTTLQANEEYVMDGLTGYSLVETEDESMAGMTESLEWDEVDAQDVDQTVPSAV